MPVPQPISSTDMGAVIPRRRTTYRVMIFSSTPSVPSGRVLASAGLARKATALCTSATGLGSTGSGNLCTGASEAVLADRGEDTNRTERLVGRNSRELGPLAREARVRGCFRRVLQLLFAGRLFLLAQSLLEQRLALGEHLALVAEARYSRGEMQQQQQDEADRDEEEGVGRVDDADCVAQRLERIAPDAQ